jgi:Acetyltransferase (GNAT) family
MAGFSVVSINYRLASYADPTTHRAISARERNVENDSEPTYCPEPLPDNPPRCTDAIWRVIEPVFRAGETYPLPRDISRDDAFAYWRAPGNEVFVAEVGGRIVGSYYLRANNRGGGSHVANCGYIVAANASRRGVARAMCVHSLERARGRGFTAMQFNFVISSLPGR